jgi:DNA repair exonuclease SbcCD ATPase subunit
VWGLVSGALKDPEQLRADLDTMIEQQISAGRRGDPEREAATWLENLADVDRKRSAYQDQQAEGLITIDELRAKLTSLEETRKTALRELEALRNHQEHIAELEADRDALLESYAEIAPDALDSLTAEQRRRFYRLLRLEMPLAPDGSLEVRGVAFPGGLGSVCGSGTSRAWSSRPTRWTFRTRARSS